VHACYVGNHPEADVAGAKAAGLKAVWRRDPFFPPPLEADAVIENVGDLVVAIQTWQRLNRPAES
jgi:putative hydrolase of the HAD superfamily